jgi:hypothetical protein
MAEIQDYQIAAQPGSPARLMMTLPHPRFCATLLVFGVRKPELGSSQAADQAASCQAAPWM